LKNTKKKLNEQSKVVRHTFTRSSIKKYSDLKTNPEKYATPCSHTCPLPDGSVHPEDIETLSNLKN
jgi:hypothetical protein